MKQGRPLRVLAAPTRSCVRLAQDGRLTQVGVRMCAVTCVRARLSRWCDFLFSRCVLGCCDQRWEKWRSGLLA